MRYRIILLITIISVCISSMAQEKNRWNIYAGGSLTHVCERPWVSADKTYDWGGGAFIGVGYEINFTRHWSLSPQVEFAFDDNGAILHAKGDYFYNNHGLWKSYWSASIPLLMAYRVSLSDKAGMRIAAGPFFQEAFSGKRYSTDLERPTEKETIPGGFYDRFNLGIMGEVAVETGRNFSYFIRAKYPLMEHGWLMHTLTLSIGIRYAF